MYRYQVKNIQKMMISLIVLIALALTFRIYLVDHMMPLLVGYPDLTNGMFVAMLVGVVPTLLVTLSKFAYCEYLLNVETDLSYETYNYYDTIMSDVCRKHMLFLYSVYIVGLLVCLVMVFSGSFYPTIHNTYHAYILVYVLEALFLDSLIEVVVTLFPFSDNLISIHADHLRKQSRENYPEQYEGLIEICEATVDCPATEGD